MGKTVLEENAERLSGETVESLRQTPLSERHERHRSKGQEMASHYPLIGRGSVLRDRQVSHQDAERAYERAIRTPWHEHLRRFFLWWRGKPTRNS